jgi:transcriptional regulator with XRE-family HTH domain
VTNHRLRTALLAADMTQAALAHAVGVDAKSVERWITRDRQPHPRTRTAVGRVLGFDETYFWPALLGSGASLGAARAELVQVWPSRSDVPAEVWRALLDQTTQQLDVLVYAGGFLVESLRLGDILRDKSAQGVQVRLLLGDPRSSAVRQRAVEEGLATLPERCVSTLEYLAGVRGLTGVAIRTHGTTLYASQFRFDDTLLVNTHTYGSWAARSPVQQYHRVPGGRLFDYYAAGFDRVWDVATPVA